MKTTPIIPKHEFSKLLDEHINDGVFTAPLTDGSQIETMWKAIETFHTEISYEATYARIIESQSFACDHS